VSVAAGVDEPDFGVDAFDEGAFGALSGAEATHGNFDFANATGAATPRLSSPA